MLSESRIKVVTVKVGRLFAPTDEQYPHYRLVPIETDRQGCLCLSVLYRAMPFFDT